MDHLDPRSITCLCFCASACVTCRILTVVLLFCLHVFCFLSQLTYLRVQGSAAERWRAISSDKAANGRVDVYLTTYETILSEEAFFTEDVLWHTLTIDEGHRLKKETSTLCQALGRVQAPFRLLLTGTPLQNNLHELFALLHFLLPKVRITRPRARSVCSQWV